MQTIAFVTQKGGSGKSTLCIGLAVAAQEAGASVGILDTDRQATISAWSKLRSSPRPHVAPVDATEIERSLSQIAFHDYVFIDTPGAAGAAIDAVIRAADFCIVPCRPTPVDLRAIRQTLGTIYRSEKPFAFVLNQTPARGYRLRDAAEALIALGVLPDVTVALRNDHQDAIGAGKSVTEFHPDGQAADEIRRLWQWTEARLRAGRALPRTGAAIASQGLAA